MSGGVRGFGVGLVLVGVLAAACTSGSSPSTTVPASGSTVVEFTTTTAAVATSTTALPATTTSVVVERLSDPLSISYPADPVTVDDLPVVLTALIGSPMPEPNLLLESRADFERWLDEWINWYTWLSANPTVDPEVLAVGFVPETDEFERQLDINRTQIEAGRRALGWWVVVDRIDDNPEEASMFEQRIRGVISFNGSLAYPIYVLDGSGRILDRSVHNVDLVMSLSVQNDEVAGWRVVSNTTTVLS